MLALIELSRLLEVHALRVNKVSIKLESASERQKRCFVHEFF